MNAEKGEQRYSSTLSLTSALWRWVVNGTPRQRDPLPIIQETGWAPGSENLSRTENRSLDRPSRSESLYGLRSPVSYLIQGLIKLAGVSTRKFIFPVERTFLEAWWVGEETVVFGLACTQVRPPCSPVVAVLAVMSR